MRVWLRLNSGFGGWREGKAGGCGEWREWSENIECGPWSQPHSLSDRMSLYLPIHTSPSPGLSPWILKELDQERTLGSRPL